MRRLFLLLALVPAFLAHPPGDEGEEGCTAENCGDGSTSMCRLENDGDSIRESCIAMEAVQAMFEAGANDSFCGSLGAVLQKDVLDNNQTVMRPMSCTPGGATPCCPSGSQCTTDPACETTSYCCVTPEVKETTEVRETTEVKDGVRKKRQVNPVGFRFLRATTEPLTTARRRTTQDVTTERTKALDCKRRFVTKNISERFEQTIISVTVSQVIPLGFEKDPDKLCPKNSYTFRGNRFIVRGCRAIFKICFEIEQTTPVGKLTTPSPEECKKVISLGGAKATVEGSIVSVEFSPLPFIPGIGGHLGGFAPGGGYGGGNIHDHCYRDVDYFYEGSTFTALGGCRGVFKVCFRPKTETTTVQAPLTTTESGPICTKVTSTGDLSGEVEGKIAYIKLLKQIILGFHFHAKICTRRENYGFQGSSYFVKNCEGVFLVCYNNDEEPQTEAPLTTTKAPLQCRKLTNTHGVRKVYDGTITAVTYIILTEGKRPSRKHPSCKEGTDYSYNGGEFVASSACIGIFRICYEPTVVTQQPLTRRPPPEKICKQVYSKRRFRQRFDGYIVSADIIKQIVIGYTYEAEVCREGTDYFYNEDTFIVTNCWALFLVCYTEEQPTTTPVVIPPAQQTTTAAANLETTTEEEEKCESVYNAYGLELNFGKDITKAIFIEIRQPRFQPRGYQRAGYRPEGSASGQQAGSGPGAHEFGFEYPAFPRGGYGSGYTPQCIPGEDYIYIGPVLKASPKCHGFFKVCLKKEEEEEQQPLTTPAPEEPECRSVSIFVPQSERFRDKVIVSVSLTRQYGHHGGSFCKEGRGYSYSGDTLKVTNCRGTFKVCVIPKPKTTAPLTTTVPVPTTTQPAICKRVYNSYGIKQQVNGVIFKVVYLQVRREQKPNGYGFDSEHTADLCHEGLGYSYEGGQFTATPFCPGFFHICYRSLDVGFYGV